MKRCIASIVIALALAPCERASAFHPSVPPTRTQITQWHPHPASRLFSSSDPVPASQQGSDPTYTTTLQSHKRLAALQKYARLPVWPAWNGALLFLLSKVLPNSTISKLEETFGGRVCPNFFETSPSSSSSSLSSPSPFIMLVHHSHCFTSFDPLRLFQKSFILPEGFPSHPHRGFITLTYCLKGGMVHRDSMGSKQLYGNEHRHGGNVAQWLVAGAGMLHEEMWDVDHGEDGIASRQELFQLWINLPGESKMVRPTTSLLNTGNDKDSGSDGDANADANVKGGNDATTPLISVPTVQGDGTETIVLVGAYNGVESHVETYSPMTILHVKMQPRSTWTMTMPESYKTGVIYMRQGSATVVHDDDPREQVGDGNGNGNKGGRPEEIIPPHYTAFLTPYGNTLTMTTASNENSEDGADFMLLVGAPLYEPVQARGSMVMNSIEEIDMAYNDYSMGRMGLPWDQNLSDDEWSEHVRKAPSVYR